MKRQPDNRVRDYLERWGIMFERLGSTRMMGKILAWLLVCKPPEQSAKDIAEAVGASAGSVSGATRGLIAAGMVEKIGVPGRRSGYFRIREGMWGDVLARKMLQGREMGELAREGLSLLSPDDLNGAIRLREIGSYCTYMERELPTFIDAWLKEWREEKRQWTDDEEE